MTTYAELVAYFKALPADVPALKGVTVGADELALSQMSATVEYPHLRVDTPNIRFVSEDEPAAQTEYKTRLFVLENVPSGDPEDDNAALSRMEVLLRAIYRRLWTDADDNLFDIKFGPNSGDAIQHYAADNCVGWWLEITIALNTATCA